MKKKRLETILSQFPQKHVLVLGDFFLDEYLLLDSTLSEPSLETGLDAFQVVERYISPGGAGTVAANLRALGAEVAVLGITGDDGHGLELRRELSRCGADISNLLTVPQCVTPTYTKPILREPDGTSRELNRLDIKNRRAIPADVPCKLAARLWDYVATVDAIVVGDQITEAVGGAVNGKIRASLEEIGRTERRVLVDSRARGNRFRNVMLKLNVAEAMAATGARSLDAAGEQLWRQTGKPAFITLGADGIRIFTATGATSVAGVPVPPPTDPVGAGDSTMAGIALALCCGASPAEAAEIGNYAAAITVQKIGCTGTASVPEIRQIFAATPKK